MAGQFSFGRNWHSCMQMHTALLPQENCLLFFSTLLTHPLPPISSAFCKNFHDQPFIPCDPHIRYGYSVEIDWHMLWIIPSRSSSSILLQPSWTPFPLKGLFFHQSFSFRTFQTWLRANDQTDNGFFRTSFGMKLNQYFISSI